MREIQQKDSFGQLHVVYDLSSSFQVSCHGVYGDKLMFMILSCKDMLNSQPYPSFEMFADVVVQNP